jgi:hypothetical protein
MSAKPTPGPWRYWPCVERSAKNDYVQIAAGAQEVAQVRIRSVTEADLRLMVAAPDLLGALKEARRAIGDHYAPNDCYATGPITGDPFRDLVQCPACSAIAMYDEVIAKIEGKK